MAINLHQNAITAVTDALSEGLKSVIIKHHQYPESFTTFLSTYSAEQKLPSNGIVREKLEAYISDYPLSDFVIEVLRQELNDEKDWNEAENTKLPEIPGYEDTAAFAARLVDLLTSIPWRYSFTLPLTRELLPIGTAANAPAEPGNQPTIFEQDLFFQSNFPLTHPNPRVEKRIRGLGMLALFDESKMKWDENVPYFQKLSDGFLGIYGGGSLTPSVERDLESLLGLGLATMLFSYNYSFENKDVRPKWTVHKYNVGKWEPFTRIDLNESISGVLRHMTSFKFPHDYPEEDKPKWINQTLGKIDRVFLSEKSGTILLASKWFFDSFKKSDDNLKYVLLMTTLEILLGEKANTSKASLGEILGNRLAYLIGKNHDDRSLILEDFKKIYGIRSNILHHGKHKLTSSERTHFRSLRTYCERAIREEVRLLLA